MSVESIRVMMVKLKDLICEAYDEDEFTSLMYVHAPEFDYAGLSASWAYNKRVFEAVRWANRFGEAKHVLWMARLVARERPIHRGLQELVRDFEQEIDPQQAAAAAILPAGGPPPPPPPLPADLTTSLALLEDSPRELAVDLRPKLRTGTYKPYDLPARFHLSASEGRRLLAVLALEAEPDTIYLRWLSERVMVEKPFAGFTAAQALTAAALRSPPADIARVRPALNAAAEALDGLVELENETAQGFDIAARKRQLQLAMSLLEMRSRKWSVLSAEDLDGFLASFVSRFDLAGIDQLCRNQLQTSLKWLANPNDPVELIVVSMVVTARDKGWLPDLIHAAYAERKDDATFAKVHNLFAPALGAMA